jgi:hypothetical protein
VWLRRYGKDTPHGIADFAQAFRSDNSVAVEFR